MPPRIPTSRRPRPAHHRRGVILILFLLAIILLAALVLWVVNMGQQVGHRVTTQHSADAAARGAAGWTARAMNSVAANNMHMARSVSLIAILDSMPTAAEYTEEELTAFHDALSIQLSHGLGGSPSKLAAIAEDYMSRVLDEVQDTLDDVSPVVAFFHTHDVGQMTEYDRGSLWQALYAMDEMNQAMVSQLAPMVQESGLRSGEANLRGAPPAVVVLPAEPQIPFVRGAFSDLRRPVRQGLLPEEIDDVEHARGPWDTIFGWRVIRYGRPNASRQHPAPPMPDRDPPRDTSAATAASSGSRQIAGGGGRPNNPLSRGEPSTPRPGGGGGGPPRVPVSYYTYGPHTWMLDEIREYEAHHMRYSRLSRWLTQISNLKLDYLFPPGGKTAEDITHDHIHPPNWEISYPVARDIADANRRGDPDVPRIRETAFFIVEIKSRYPKSSGAFLSAGSYALAFDDANKGENPRIAILGGWQDPGEWGIEQTNQWVWRDEWSYNVYFDTEIGIMPRMGPSGAPVVQEVYRYDYIAFGGANLEEDYEPRNPFAGFDPTDPGAPAPMNLDTTLVTHDNEDAQFDYLTFLAAAQRPDVPQVWPSRFHGGRPQPVVMALAQARVFNNHSWDLWTPMWRAEMQPISNRDGRPGIDDWINRIEPSDQTYLRGQSLDNLRTYLEASRALATETLGH